MLGKETSGRERGHFWEPKNKKEKNQIQILKQKIIRLSFDPGKTFFFIAHQFISKDQKKKKQKRKTRQGREERLRNSESS